MRRGLHVIVGVDGSPQSVLALRWACRHAQMSDDRVRAVCAWSLGASGEDWRSRPGPQAEGQQRTERVLRDAVSAVRRDCPAAEVETLVVRGEPGRVLVDMSADADLLVVGFRSRGGASGLLLGSVSQYCVRHAHCPVTVVRRTNRGSGCGP